MPAFVDYDNLLQAVSDWLARDDLGDRIPDFVWLAECEIQRDLNLRMNDSVYESTSVSGQDYVSLPEDFAEAVLFEWKDSSKSPVSISSFDVVSSFQKKNRYRSSETSTPRSGAVFGDRLYLGPVPSASDFRLFYRSGVSHLSHLNKTNDVLRKYPDALLYGSLLHSAPYLGEDERALGWVQLYDRAKDSAFKEEWRSRTGHGPLRMQPDIGVR
tara:strand:- start:44 stop:685 length:642 start_codon:yes stop_codon:yes gene_type:complete